MLDSKLKEFRDTGKVEFSIMQEELVNEVVKHLRFGNYAFTVLSKFDSGFRGTVIQEEEPNFTQK